MIVITSQTLSETGLSFDEACALMGATDDELCVFVNTLAHPPLRPEQLPRETQ